MKKYVHKQLPERGYPCLAALLSKPRLESEVRAAWQPKEKGPEILARVTLLNRIWLLMISWVLRLGLQI